MKDTNENSENLKDCNSCDSCYYCYYSKGLRMSEKMIFCLGEGRHKSKGIGYQKNHMAFNKKVSEERYDEILGELRKILEDLKLELNEESWSDEWKKVTRKQWIEISKIPEFDKGVVEGITGIELDLDKTELYSKETIENAKRILKDVGEL